MTSTTRDDALAGVLAGTAPVLLAFDGPVTALMPGGVDRAIADAMRLVLHRAAGEVPVEIADTNDPLAVLRVTAATQPTETLAAVENACRAGEIDAATHSEPTSGAHEAMRACRDAGRPIVIVSNNAAEADRGLPEPSRAAGSRPSDRGATARAARPDEAGPLPDSPGLSAPRLAAEPVRVRRRFRHRRAGQPQYRYPVDRLRRDTATRPGTTRRRSRCHHRQHARPS